MTYRSEDQEIGIRWIDGDHPSLGEVIKGRNGFETIQKFSRTVNCKRKN